MNYWRLIEMDWFDTMKIAPKRLTPEEKKLRERGLMAALTRGYPHFYNTLSDTDTIDDFISATNFYLQHPQNRPLDMVRDLHRLLDLLWRMKHTGLILTAEGVIPEVVEDLHIEWMDEQKRR